MQIPAKFHRFSIAPDLLIMAASDERAQFYDALEAESPFERTPGLAGIGKRKLLYKATALQSA